jgi:predicted membrane channel-forming protein YqfA (hemolysin III family)
MDLLMLIVVIAIIGAVVWFLTTQVPMPPVFKTVIYIVCAIVLVLFLIHQFGGHLPNLMR